MKDIKENKVEEKVEDNKPTEVVDTKKENVNEEENVYNNKDNKAQSSLEEEVNNEKERKYLAKVIVDLKEENSTIKSMLEKVLNSLNTKSDNFIDSKVKDEKDSEWIINVKDN